MKIALQKAAGIHASRADQLLAHLQVAYPAAAFHQISTIFAKTPYKELKHQTSHAI